VADRLGITHRLWQIDQLRRGHITLDQQLGAAMGTAGKEAGMADELRERGSVIPTVTERPVLSVPEAGALLGLGRSAAYGAVARGELPVVWFGRKALVPTARLRALLGLENDE
jgi:excisionase family DNA binding protein